MARFDSIKMSEVLKIFTVLVVPVMTYNCEICALALPHRDFLKLEAFYVKQLKRILGVGRKTCNAAVHMELGTFLCTMYRCC